MIDYTVVPAARNARASSAGGIWISPTATDTAPPAPGDTTVFTVPVEVIWDTDVTLMDITVDLPAGSTDAGLFVDSGGDVQLIRVHVSGGSSGAEVDAAGECHRQRQQLLRQRQLRFADLLLRQSSHSRTWSPTGNNTGIFIDNTYVDPVTGLSPTVHAEQHLRGR